MGTVQSAESVMTKSFRRIASPDPKSSQLERNLETFNAIFNGNIRLEFVMIDTAGKAASPVGSEIFTVVALLVISLGVLLLLRHYLPLRTTPAYLLVPIFFALGLPASIILLVPIDLASSARNQDAGSRGVWLPDKLLLVGWRISYWLTFALTWYVFHGTKLAATF